MINLDVDDLKLYIGDDYVINDNIKVLQPTIRQIAEFGERDFFSVVHTVTAIPSDMKSQLWDMGLDWTEVDDFELFVMLVNYSFYRVGGNVKSSLIGKIKTVVLDVLVILSFCITSTQVFNTNKFDTLIKNIPIIIQIFSYIIKETWHECHVFF